MRRYAFFGAAMLLLASLVLVVQDRSPARGQDHMPAGASAAVGLFYDALLPYGEWIWTASCGWVWAPYDVPVDWRPYSNGHWVNTDDYGYYWESDEPWAWACYHYGRWYYDTDYGWVWCPRDQWGPAWVAWADADDVIGWCPLPPSLSFDVGVGFNLRGINLFTACPSFGFSFCDIDDFLRPDLDDCLLPFHRNDEFFRRCRLNVGISFRRDRIFCHAPFEDRFVKRLGRPITRFKVNDVRSVHELHISGSRRDVVRIFRPDSKAIIEGRARWKPSIVEIRPRVSPLLRPRTEIPLITAPREPDIMRRQNTELRALGERHRSWQNWMQDDIGRSRPVRLRPSPPSDSESASRRNRDRSDSRWTANSAPCGPGNIASCGRLRVR